ncbi:peptide ABC transporter substrate-binding protein [Bremerella cremea]|uniref:Peptide ABC transporter substrate-binding protein n=1 Tax=Bremerella cremea TaxID=1031537 RepID=A0A368KL68_9BACT|nr:ABC transporter substrate-binding protein [Bremerella cremea]RCS40560.1 peptide ABC transporter substrate-binding protein [Bremerella cremea]
MADIRGALRLCLVSALALLVPLVGCKGRSSELSEEELKQAIADFDFDAGLPDPQFQPPQTLEELDATYPWTDKKITLPLADLKKELADYQPPITPQEAMKLRPTDQAGYDEILAAMKIQPKSENEAAWDSTWVHHEGGDVNSLNPLRMSSVGDSFYVAMTQIGAVAATIDIEPLGDGRYIKSWQANDDNTVQKIVIRDDMTWSDGTPITAHDWEFTFKVIIHPKLLTMFPALPSGVEGIKLIKAYDDHTFVVFHEQSTAVNDMKLDFPIVPKHIYEPAIAEDPTLTDSSKFQEIERNPVVSGPYKVISREHKQRIVLQRREDYYMHNGKQVREKPYFKEIRVEIMGNPTQALLAMTKGDIDDMEVPPTMWNTEANREDFYKNNIKVKYSGWSESHLTWNLGRPYFEDARVRRALSYAVNYDAILNGVLDGIHEQANGPFHPTAWFSPKPALPLFTTDLDKARALLDEAGWKDTDADGIRDKVINGQKNPFTFTLTYAEESSTGEQVATQLASDFGKIGVKLVPRKVEWTTMQQQTRDHNFDASYSGWASGGDPFSNDNIFKTDAPRNFGQYSNKQVDELFDKGLVELDREKRATHYQEIAKILYEDQPYTWLYFRTDLFAFNKKLRGYRFGPTGPWNYAPGAMSVWKTTDK